MQPITLLHRARHIWCHGVRVCDGLSPKKLHLVSKHVWLRSGYSSDTSWPAIIKAVRVSVMWILLNLINWLHRNSITGCEWGVWGLMMLQQPNSIGHERRVLGSSQRSWVPVTDESYKKVANKMIMTSRDKANREQSTASSFWYFCQIFFHTSVWCILLVKYLCISYDEEQTTTSKISKCFHKFWEIWTIFLEIKFVKRQSWLKLYKVTAKYQFK